MAILITWSLILIGFLLITIAVFWGWSIALRESPTHGVWYVLWFYTLYYVITRWDKTRRPYLLAIIGAALVLLGVAIGVANGIL